jgi:hypothetical protein
MSSAQGKYTLEVHVTLQWGGQAGYSALGFITDEFEHFAAWLALRGPFDDFEQAQQAALQRLYEMVLELEDEDWTPSAPSALN